MTTLSTQEILNAAQANAKAQYLIGGGDAEAALTACEKSHYFPELTADRALYVGAYMDTIWRLRGNK